MLVDALHATLEYTVKALNGIGMNITSDVFSKAMAGEPVYRKVLINPVILPCVVRHNGGFRHDISLQYRYDISGSCSVHMKRTPPFAALYEGKHRVFVAEAGFNFSPLAFCR